MYVTKHNMANAVSGMTKHLEQVSAALAVSMFTSFHVHQYHVISDFFPIFSQPSGI
jgi:hypothetical protein